MNLTESIVLVYDPLKTAQGMTSFRAFRITQEYLDMIDYDPETGECPEPTLEELRKNKIFTKVSRAVHGYCWFRTFGSNSTSFPEHLRGNSGDFEDILLGEYVDFWLGRAQSDQPGKDGVGTGHFGLARATHEVHKPKYATNFCIRYLLSRLLDKLVDEVVNDSNRFNQYQKMLSKNNQQRQNWLTKRRQENEQRRANGQEELSPDEVRNAAILHSPLF